MRKVPQRKIKSRLRQLFWMISLFFLTLILCGGLFTYMLFSSFHIISPLTRLGMPMSQQQVVAQVQSACSKLHMSCQQIVTLPDGSLEMIVDTTTVFLSPQKSIEKQLASLQQVASQLTIKGKVLKKVDFRFDNVIVSF